MLHVAGPISVIGRDPGVTMFKEVLRNIVARKQTIPFPEEFRVTPGQAAKIVDFQKKIDTIFGRSLRIRQVDGGSRNACEWECTALTNPVYDIQRFGIDFVASPSHADVLLVSGPCPARWHLLSSGNISQRPCHGSWWAAAIVRKTMSYIRVAMTS